MFIWKFQRSKTFYAQLKNYTYHSNRNDNDNSFSTSWKSEPALKMHLNFLNVINKKAIISGSIIRGSYNKEYADGNQKLYDKDVTKGKFTI